jgi:hypothetical protein
MGITASKERAIRREREQILAHAACSAGGDEPGPDEASIGCHGISVMRDA